LDGTRAAPLAPLERAGLALPLVVSAAVGLPMYVFARPFARLAGLSGDEVFIYQLGGAAMLGYVVAIALGLRGTRWSPMRFVVAATYGFAALAFLGGVITFASGIADGFVVLMTIWAVITGWVLGQILVARRGAPAGPRTVASWVIVVLALATVSAALFGLAPQVAVPFATLMGYRGTDEYVYRLAGAACFGYAVMGVLELRSLSWDDMRLPNVMALVFNGLAAIAAVSEILAGRVTLLAVLVALAAGFFTLAIAVILVRSGR
jgi:hypothetical protein